jgi:hypothetical protein
MVLVLPSMRPIRESRGQRIVREILLDERLDWPLTAAAQVIVVRR